MMSNECHWRSLEPSRRPARGGRRPLRFNSRTGCGPKRSGVAHPTRTEPCRRLLARYQHKGEASCDTSASGRPRPSGICHRLRHLAFGGDWDLVDLNESTTTIHRALELGINLFDTAQGYGFGVAERRLGDALRQGAGARKSSLPLRAACARKAATCSVTRARAGSARASSRASTTSGPTTSTSTRSTGPTHVHPPTRPP